MSPNDFPSLRINNERHTRLLQISPLDAAHALFDRAFGIGDESAIGFSIRKDPRIRLDDAELMDLFFEASNQGLGPKAFLELATKQS